MMEERRVKDRSWVDPRSSNAQHCPSHSDKNIKTLPADSPTEHSKVKREKLTRFQTPKRLRLVFRV